MQFNCLSDYGVTGAVNNMESDSRYGICSKVGLSMNPKTMNESEDPESTRDIIGVLGINSEVTRIMRASGVVMEVLRVMVVCTRMGDMQPPGGAGFWRLLNLFLPPQ